MGTPIRHPLIDAVSARVVRVDSRSRVVRLSPPLADLLARRRGRRRVVLVTGESSRLTVGTRAALVHAGAAWAVTDEHGDLRDGLTGSPYADLDAAGWPPTGGDGPDDDALAQETTAVREAVDTTAQLSVDLTVLHRTDHDTTLGGAVEALSEAVAGAVPDRWGETEPLRRPWDRWVLTQSARHAAPELVRVVVEGPGLSGTVTARVTENGIEETTALTITVPVVAAAGRAETDPVDAAVERLTEALSEIARTSVPTFALVVAREGEPDRSVRAVTYPPPNPVVLLIGAPSVARLGLAASTIPVPRPVTVVGRPRLPAYVVSLGDAATSGWDALHDTLDAVGPERLAEMVSPPLLEAWEDDLHEHDLLHEGRGAGPEARVDDQADTDTDEEAPPGAP
ncbi:hypothetical protein ES689_01770 [Frigoribacterium sp. ACAM 257]|uniref:DUF6177 family protein n=1 Tax=Frigoribacterium sp. ACAM 257 TaxID=2508998 RepID=UPI0011B95590|nr:DUF6177 family protein [Frigoribacterium sp. ACAM 257]TWX40222.1 hypothetical protein ES689_01770 [Frigoribacterium sp. ACAM 257]